MRFARLAAAAALIIAPLAGVAAAPAGAQAGDAKVRVAHFSPDAPAIDVYIDGKKKLTNVPYQAVSDYLALPAGNHTFDIRAAGSPATGVPVITASQALTAGKSYTVAAVGMLAAISGKVIEDDVAAPASGKAKVRLIHAAADVPAVDATVKGGQALASNLALGAAGSYVELPAGSYELEIRAAGNSAVILTKPVTLQSGGVYTIAAVGGGDKAPTLRGFVDLAPSATAAVTTAPAAAATTIAAAPTTAAGAATTLAAAATTKAAAPTTLAGAATTKAAAPTTLVAAATTKAAAPTTLVAAATTKASAATVAAGTASTTKVTPTTAAAKPTTTVAKPTTTVAKPTTTVAKPTTTEAASDSSLAASDTTEATTDTSVADTSVADTSVADTEATTDTEADTTTTKVPVGAVSTGAGGLPGGGVLLPVLMLLLVAGGAVATGALRRRNV